MSNREKCFAVVHIRAHNNVASLLALKHVAHYQAHSMLARSLFELAVDLALLEAEAGTEEKVLCFHELETLRLVRASKALSQTHPENWQPTSKMEAFQLNRANEIEARARDLWPGLKLSNLKHWSGLSLEDRVKSPDFEMQQNQKIFYRLMSWSAHPGTAGHLNLPDDGVPQTTAMSLDLARTQYSRVLRSTAKTFMITRVDQDIDKRISFAQVSAYAETPEEEALFFRQAGLVD